MDILVDELQTVTVTGDHHTLPAVVRADLANGADDIVRFPALTFIDRNIHGPQNILHHRHLHGKLLRHAVPVCLIAVIL